MVYLIQNNPGKASVSIVANPLIPRREDQTGYFATNAAKTRIIIACETERTLKNIREYRKYLPRIERSCCDSINIRRERHSTVHCLLRQDLISTITHTSAISKKTGTLIFSATIMVTEFLAIPRSNWFGLLTITVNIHNDIGHCCNKKDGRRILYRLPIGFMRMDKLLKIKSNLCRFDNGIQTMNHDGHFPKKGNGLLEEYIYAPKQSL